MGAVEARRMREQMRQSAEALERTRIGRGASNDIKGFCAGRGLSSVVMNREAVFWRRDADGGESRKVGLLRAEDLGRGRYWHLDGRDDQGGDASFSCGRAGLVAMLRDAWDAGWGR